MGLRPIGVALGLCVCAFASSVTPALAQRSLAIEELHSDIEVRPAGDIVVTETLRPRFRGQWNGILRHLRIVPPAAYGGDYLLDVSLISATDGDGRPLRHEVNRVDRVTREFRVWVPDARDRTATVVLRYGVRNALGFFEADSAGGWDAWDELNWQVTGTEWDVPIERASATVRLPAGVEPMQATAYVGAPGSNDRAPVTIGPEGVEVPPTGPLSPGEGLTVAVGWPAGAVARPTPEQRAARTGAGGPTGGAGPTEPPSPLAILPVLLPFLVFFGAYRAWDRRGRDPAEKAITVGYEPPPGLSPAEAGTLVDHSPEMHDIVSTLVDLAVRGYLIIEEREKGGFLSSGGEYTFHLLKPRPEWDGLADHERAFLSGLFTGRFHASGASAAAAPAGVLGRIVEAVTGPRRVSEPPEGAVASVDMSDLRNEFYKVVPDIRSAILDALVRKGHYLRRPDKVRRRWLFLAAVAGALGFLGLPLIDGGTATAMATGVALFAAAGASFLILLGFALVMPARTPKGARTREAILGFERFLERVESPRFRRMITSPDMFERYLPYAMAFRCEDRWAKAFDDLLTEPPGWYVGGSGHFVPSSFGQSLHAMASTAGSTMSSSPSNSASGGGGSVGGGGGGGGGGGF